jgi:hypothetical protein
MKHLASLGVFFIILYLINGAAYAGGMVCQFLVEPVSNFKQVLTPSQKWSFPMSAPAFDRETNPNLTKFQIEQPLPTKEELKQQIEQLINQDYQRPRGLSLGIMIAVVIWIITVSAIWLAWI